MNHYYSPFYEDKRLKPLTPYFPMTYDRTTHAIYGEKANAYHQQQLSTPIYLDKGFSVGEEKAIYMRFRTNVDPSGIRLLHAYYKACGLVKLEDRIVRFQQLYELQI